MERKKLAFIIPSLKVGGAERVVSTLSNELCNVFDITIIVFYKCTPFYTLKSNINVVYCLEAYSPEKSFFSSISTHFKLLYKSYSIIKKEKIDVIIGFMTTANVYSVIISKLTKASCIINERAHPKLDDVNTTWRKIRRKLYPSANKLVLQTDAVKKHYNDFIDASKMEVINNPLSDKLLKQLDSSITKEKYILSVGRLDNTKNQELLIKAFANIKANGWKVKIAGDGIKRDYLKSLIKSLNKEEDIILLGNVSNISEYYNNASIFVFTSNNEGFPNALIEAMCFGVACISTNCEFGPSELIDDAVNGFLIPVNDQLELENKLQTLILDTNLQNTFSTNAMKNTSKFEVDFIGQKWKELIYKVCV
ncbi:glycosyltransferase family 4 protein [Lacinutrix himadriensis]|uniref:glycosyltransferase family 4 protein n=1 Tax=Lacinutrix himadriensis TaxID=641549 RepID=UPI0006E2E66E|nr:glycosyltransferase family 4 protein [Lacinutrix himadriensis]